MSTKKLTGAELYKGCKNLAGRVLVDKTPNIIDNNFDTYVIIEVKRNKYPSDDLSDYKIHCYCMQNKKKYEWNVSQHYIENLIQGIDNSYSPLKLLD